MKIELKVSPDKSIILKKILQLSGFKLNHFCALKPFLILFSLLLLGVAMTTNYELKSLRNIFFSSCNCAEILAVGF